MRSAFHTRQLLLAMVIGALISTVSTIAYVNSEHDIATIVNIFVSTVSLAVFPGYILAAYISNNIHNTNLFIAGVINFFLYGGFRYGCSLGEAVDESKETRQRLPDIATSWFALSACEFTGKERDQETGLDFFNARYMSSAQGRFTSPDPSTDVVLHIVNPQRWNQYAYAINNPTSFLDPDGKDAAAVNFSGMVHGQRNAFQFRDPRAECIFWRGDHYRHTSGRFPAKAVKVLERVGPAARSVTPRATPTVMLFVRLAGGVFVLLGLMFLTH